MTIIWTGPKVGGPPPTPKELKVLTEGLVIELNLTGTRASELRQAIRPWLYPPPADSAPEVPPPSEEEIRGAVENISDQLGLDLKTLLDKVDLR